MPAIDSDDDADALRILFAESYADGSHLQVANLLQRDSRHRIDLLTIPRDHWRTIALTGHRSVSRVVKQLDAAAYDLVVYSGPVDIRLLRASTSNDWSKKPTAVYFHESQWTYPSDSLDRIPHLVNHLETLEICDAVWFNSRFHQRTFYETAMNHPSTLVRNLAREIIPAHWPKTMVLYPPVEIPKTCQTRDNSFRIAWSARWERDKRPDLLLAIAGSLLQSGIAFRLHILGTPRERWIADVKAESGICAAVDPRSGYLEANDYVSVLGQSNVWLSTAEHEYFGISAIEAAMLGAVPVVPDALAYSETLPSAVSYAAGDVGQAAASIRMIHDGGRFQERPWQSDAMRFASATQIDRFDNAVDQLVHTKRRES